MDDPKEIPLEEAPTHKEFYVFVSYSGDGSPWCTVSDKRDNYVSSYDEVYKVLIPYRKTV